MTTYLDDETAVAFYADGVPVPHYPVTMRCYVLALDMAHGAVTISYLSRGGYTTKVVPASRVYAAPIARPRRVLRITTRRWDDPEPQGAAPRRACRCEVCGA